ncbi:hypothetical protein [Saccharolobus sp.]|uniref:hypothetical protein n=1 Tax=Saccharolobus sp. TaxID=2100761 RepID=UPI0031826C8A
MRTCNICNSPEKIELERMYREGKTIKSIEQYCREHNYNFTYGMLYYHFKNHLIRDNDTIPIPTNLINRLINNLEICDRKISEMINSNQIEPNILIRYISEIRHTVVELRNLLKEYNVKETKPESIFNMILSLMHDLPEEWIKKFQERYLKWRENPNLSPIYY